MSISGMPSAHFADGKDTASILGFNMAVPDTQSVIKLEVLDDMGD